MPHPWDIVAYVLNVTYEFTLIFPDQIVTAQVVVASQATRECIKSRKHTFKNLHNFVQSLTIGDKLLVFSDKLLHVCISSQKPQVGQKPKGSPGVA